MTTRNPPELARSIKHLIDDGFWLASNAPIALYKAEFDLPRVVELDFTYAKIAEGRAAEHYLRTHPDERKTLSDLPDRLFDGLYTLLGYVLKCEAEGGEKYVQALDASLDRALSSWERMIPDMVRSYGTFSQMETVMREDRRDYEGPYGTRHDFFAFREAAAWAILEFSLARVEGRLLTSQAIDRFAEGIRKRDEDLAQLLQGDFDATAPPWTPKTFWWCFRDGRPS